VPEKPPPKDEEDDEPVLPPSIVPQFQGVNQLCEMLLMHLSMSRTPMERHDYGIAFLIEAATVFQQRGRTEEAKALWSFLDTYQSPRLRTVATRDEHGTTVTELEEIGLATEGRKHTVGATELLPYIKLVSNKLALDAFIQKLAKTISKAQAVLIELGVLKAEAPRVTPFSFGADNDEDDEDEDEVNEAEEEEADEPEVQEDDDAPG